MITNTRMVSLVSQLWQNSQVPDIQVDKWQQRKQLSPLSTTSIQKVSGRSFVRTGSKNIGLFVNIVSAGDAVVVNPEISSGIPIAGLNRYPPPGSRPEKYSTPATKGSCMNAVILSATDFH